MDKLLDFEERFPKTGEPTVQLVAFNNHRGGLTIEKRAFAEGGSPLYDFLKTVQPEAGCSFILVNALGAYEFYDDNRNGDGFPAQPFKVGQLATCGHEECTKSLDGWISEPETLIHHYRSFEKFGGIYKHHVNKDPAKSLGYIQKAVWNSHMRRVELLLKIVNSRDPELAKRIGDGDFPAVSMGCHVRWDVCTICGHHAPTRAQYCEHARMSLRKVMPDGRKVAVLNPSPKFFDISFVFRPADPTGWMLKKVAEHGGPFRSSAENAEEAHSLTRRTYEIRQNTLKVAEELAGPFGRAAVELVSSWPRLGTAEKEVLAAAGGRSALSSLAAVGVPLGAGEVIAVLAKSAEISAPTPIVDRLVALGPVLDELVAAYPSVQDKLGHLIDLRLDAVKPDLLKTLGPWIEKRGGLGDYILDEAASPSSSDGLSFGPYAAYRAHQAPKTEVLTITHPMTGEQWQTTRGEAIKAHHREAKAELVGTALLGALYTGLLSKAFSPESHAIWTVPVGLGAGYLTQKKLRKLTRSARNPYYMTDQGIPVSGHTEFVKVSALARPNVSDALHKKAFDYVERTGSPDYAVLLDKIAREGGAAYANWLARVPLSEKVATIVRGAEIPGEQPGAHSLKLKTVIHNINDLIWR